MPAPLTPAGEDVISELAQRYRVSDGAVRTLLDAVVRGGGGMAQFSHPDLGGSGQWMRGGMTMVGDMFNPGLQATVSGICSELSARIGGGEILMSRPEGASAATGRGAFGDPAGFGGGDSWWPAELGRPSSSGGQNDGAYAYFPGPRRLAIRRGPAVTIYDTGDHVISGVQQQGGHGSLEFSSQLGRFTVETLPRVEEFDASRVRPSKSADLPPPPAPAVPDTAPTGTATSGASTASEIGSAIETLAGLRDKGFLTADEFTAKKTELLARL